MTTREVHHVTTVCGAGSCPTVYDTPSGNTVIVQGYARTLDGQPVIEIPSELLAEYARIKEL